MKKITFSTSFENATIPYVAFFIPTQRRYIIAHWYYESGGGKDIYSPGRDDEYNFFERDKFISIIKEHKFI